MSSSGTGEVESIVFVNVNCIGEIGCGAEF
jgi:hypothetical protein